VLVVAGAVLAIAIRRIRARRGGARPPLVVAFAWLRKHRRSGRRHVLLGDTGLVAAREIRERLRGRVFRVVTAILFAVVAAAVVIPTIHSANSAPNRVGVVGASPALDDEIRSVAMSVKFSVRLIDEPDLSSATAALSAGRVNLVVDGTNTLLVNTPVSAGDSSAGAQFVRGLAATLGAEKAFTSAGLTPSQAATVARAKAVPVNSLHPGKAKRTTAESTALIGVIIIFIVLTQYLTWTLMGVMEEKASRVVEVLLATVRPIQLLAGKLLGIGVVAMVQAGALVAFALVLADAVGSSILRGASPLVVASSFVWLVLGYAFYSWLYAAAGSLAERQDQVQSMALPLSSPMIFGYIVALTGASSGSPSLLVKVLAYLPPTAPFAMPTLVGYGQVTWWQVIASVAISLLATVGVAFAAARVYRRAVLRTGRRVRLRDVVTSAAGG
jgi:ABC-2 type transport system permease protein